MKCEDIKLLLMDFLYEEISPEDKQILKTHLNGCAQCREEFLALRETSGILQKWEEVEPNLNFIFIKEKQSLLGRLKENLSFSPRKIVYGFALGFASVILILSLVNTELTYREGHFSLKMSIFPRKAEQAPGSTFNQEELVAQIQQKNMQYINQLFEQNERRQQQQLVSSFTKFSRDFENWRTTDLRLMGAGLDEIEKNLYLRLDRRTNDQLNNLIRYINENQGTDIRK